MHSDTVSSIARPMDQAYTDLAVYVGNSVLEDPNTFPQEYQPRLLNICEDYHKDDQYDAHLKAWDLTYVVAHDLPLNEDAETKLQNRLRMHSRVIEAGQGLRGVIQRLSTLIHPG